MLRATDTASNVSASGTVSSVGNSPISLAYSSNATGAGNNNFISSVVNLTQSATATTVNASVLGQITYTGAATTWFDATGHMIGTFGFAIMNSAGATIPLMFGAEGKIQVTAGTVTNAAAVQAGLADNTGTIGTYTGVNAQITGNHGTITTVKGFDFGITQSNLVTNLFSYNGQDVSQAQATNAGTFRSQMTAGTAHYAIFADGGAQSGHSGAFYIGALTTAGNSSKLEVTGVAEMLTDRGLRFTNQTSSAGGNTATMTNSPASGNPAFWVKVTVNGTSGAIPVWLG